MKVSIIITAYKEPKTVKNIFEILVQENQIKDYEIILACPDTETKQAAEEVCKKYSFGHYIHLQDPGKGKPTALNLALQKASGEILVCSDGDVILESESIYFLVKALEKNKHWGAVSGRPCSYDERTNIFGYFGHLLTDAAHKKRLDSQPKENEKKHFFPVSGYLFAFRTIPFFQIPSDVLSDDAYISYFIFHKGASIGYAPEARVFVKFPKNFRDWYNQKARSLGGYEQLQQYDFVQKHPQTRSFFQEIRYSLFVLTYPKNIREFLYSFLLFFIRGLLWIRIFYDRRIAKKDFLQTWVRIESTK